MKPEVERWLKQAKSDLLAAKNSVVSKNYDWAVFQGQQAAEKALKALLLQRNQQVPKVHDLVFLGKKAVLEDSLLQKCDQLTVVYIETRYPDFGEKIPAEKFNLEKAQKYLGIAEEICLWVDKEILKN